MPENKLVSQESLYPQDSTVRLTAFGSILSQGSSTAEQFEGITVRQPGGADELYPVPSISPRIPALQPLQRDLTNGLEQQIADIPGYIPAIPYSTGNTPLDGPHST